MSPDIPAILTAVAAGLAIGGAIGAAVLLSNFCALGGVADILFARDWRRLRAWVLAAGVAIVGAHGLDTAGLIRLDLSAPLAPYVLWLPALLGGLLFGFGMALAGGCISRALARIGAGSLKSLLIVAAVALSAAATGYGVLAPLNAALARTAVLETFGPGGLHRILANVPFLHPEAVRWALVALIGGSALWFALKDPWFRRSRDHVAGGLTVGLMVTAAWLVSGRLAAADGGAGFTAINFVPPLADLAGALPLGVQGRAPAPFPVALVLGVPLGALIAGALTRNLAREPLGDRADTWRSLIGGALMGAGGTIAAGCTFGQGLSGVSALSPTAFVTVAGLAAGIVWGIRYFEAGSLWGGLKLALKRA